MCKGKNKCHVTFWKPIQQMTNFAIVGVIATIIDFIIYYILTKTFAMNYQWANIISVIIATLFNYWGSMTYVFESRYRQEEKIKEFIAFIILSLMSLMLTAALLYVFVQALGWNQQVSKIFAIGFTMIFNFVTRKLFFETLGH